MRQAIAVIRSKLSPELGWETGIEVPSCPERDRTPLAGIDFARFFVI